ncbi:MAG: hypothetical protein DMD84_25400 [Candidatus Rokuibacteriota bacterium]|nr:MAG: hypothetical protein DMD84_25400 [Candidatus Rokubacteria bacterium]
MSQRPPSRRTFLTGAAIAGAALGIGRPPAVPVRKKS